MNLGMSDRVRPLVAAVRDFIDERIIPAERTFRAEINDGKRFELSDKQRQILDDLKSAARKQGLWNFWLTEPEAGGGAGLSTVEYAWLAEEMGRSQLAAEVFNCNAPDTGNMEVLLRYGSDQQKARWLQPLLEGQIRSAFAMTEPGVASSDASNISTTGIERDGSWVINGEKTYITGAGDPRCAVMIVMALTDPDGPKRQRHSQILVPTDTPGV
ncbi:MAG: acyl-CoA dehydrogenase family protein, partial [Gammaproteobacteria bacterium]|nr:acyl-CoA dehydrogenase family protein [Gammaproteobacteria bacterium]